jgi:hypothetical protein
MVRSEPRRVMLIDGEMPAIDLRGRFEAIASSTGGAVEKGMLGIICGDLMKMVASAILLTPECSKTLSVTLTVSKLNAQLAAAAAKAMTARPSQLEFRAFMQNNPGLMTSVQGSRYLISVLRQASEQDIGLSRKAMDKRSWDRWSEVEDKFYKRQPDQESIHRQAALGR